MALISPHERFVLYSNQSADTNACWLWSGPIDKDGYGKFGAGHGGLMLRAHRYAYEQAYGKIPEGLVPDHKCRVRHCVNPAHLEAVTPGENTKRGRGIASLNRERTHCKVGHPLEGDNLYVCPRGKRECRTCRTEAVRKFRTNHMKESD